ncbi:MAG: transposase family protein [Bacteroidota bacterium]
MDDDTDSSSDHDIVLSLLTTDEFLELGLSVWYTDDRVATFNYERRVKSFVDFYGCKPKLVATLWEDLQRTDVNEARLAENRLVPKNFLMALHTLKKYPTDNERVGPWDINRDAGRDAVWYYLERIQALKAEVIVWPDNWGEDLWIVTVDGTHCWITEPTHPDWSQDKRYFSHKHKKAGINYELAIAIATSQLVWMNGPFPAGRSDNKIFAEDGLKDRLANIGKKAIGDKGYNGHRDTCSTFNSHDSRAVKKFKSRALKRHETFNNLTKRFDCLKHRF